MTNSITPGRGSLPLNGSRDIPFPLDVPKPHITPKPPATGVQGSDPMRTKHADVARQRFEALERGLMIPSAATEPITVKEFTGLPERGSSWPHGQMVAATLDRAMLTGDFSTADRALRGFDRFRSPDGAITDFSPEDWPADKGPMHRYYDDNAWAGLDYAQAWHQTGKPEYLARATEFFDFLMQAKGANGGLRWKESLDHLNTASTGPALQLALRLYSATGDERFMREAKEMDKFMSGPIRRQPDGLLQDHINTDGSIEPTLWSYNTGVAIGADVQFYEILKLTDEKAAKRYLDRAVSTGRAAMAHFGQEDRLWGQNPAFNAILFRNLLNLDRVAPDPQIRTMMTQYLARAESTAMQDGLVNGGGIGRYDNGKSDAGTPLIDQSAFVQMHALLAMSPEQLKAVS